MPPIPMDGDHAEKKNKLDIATVAQGIRTSGFFSEQLTKQEWEQVSNQTVH